MTWNAFRSRGEILRDVTAVADARQDGALPWDVAGVPPRSPTSSTCSGRCSCAGTPGWPAGSSVS